MQLLSILTKHSVIKNDDIKVPSNFIIVPLYIDTVQRVINAASHIITSCTHKLHKARKSY